MIIGGCDPGATGAVGIWDDSLDLPVGVLDLPNYNVTVANKKRTHLDEQELYDLFAFLRNTMDMQLLVIEKVQGWGGKGQSASAAFQFGDTFATIRTTAKFAGLQIHLASPAVWKLQENLPRKAEGVAAQREICKKAVVEFPSIKRIFYGARGGPRHDRAEAMFLARYAAKRIWPALQPRAKLREATK